MWRWCFSLASKGSLHHYDPYLPPTPAFWLGLTLPSSQARPFFDSWHGDTYAKVSNICLLVVSCPLYLKSVQVSFPNSFLPPFLYPSQSPDHLFRNCSASTGTLFPTSAYGLSSYSSIKALFNSHHLQEPPCSFHLFSYSILNLNYYDLSQFYASISHSFMRSRNFIFYILMSCTGLIMLLYNLCVSFWLC